jgi:hypothetical protein
MAEIVQFPTFDQREWMRIETSLVDELVKNGLGPEEADWIRAEWKRRLLAAGAAFEHQLSFEMPADTPPQAIAAAKTAMEKLAAQYCALTQSLCGQLLLAVGDLYAARLHGGPPPSADQTQAVILKFLSTDGADASEGLKKPEKET